MIVITGASGFIGSNLVRELNARGRTDLIAVDDYPWIRGPGRATTHRAGVRYGDRMSVAGFVDFHDLTRWLDREGSAVESVVHLGACSDTTVTDRKYVMANNYVYSQSLWRWCTLAQRPFVYASSAATYGDGRHGYEDRSDPARLRPLNLYGESKHRFDLWALRQSRTPPRWAGLKYFNVYGPNEGHKGRMASVVYHGYRQLAETGCVRLFQSHREGVADGGQQRDFIHVRDVVAATLHFLGLPVTPQAPNGLYNVGTGHARCFGDLVRAVFAALRREPSIVYVPMPEDLRGRYQYYTQATVEKLRSAGFVHPMWSLEEGVRNYVQEHLINEARAA